MSNSCGQLYITWRKHHHPAIGKWAGLEREGIFAQIDRQTKWFVRVSDARWSSVVSNGHGLSNGNTVSESFNWSFLSTLSYSSSLSLPVSSSWSLQTGWRFAACSVALVSLCSMSWYLFPSAISCDCRHVVSFRLWSRLAEHFSRASLQVSDSTSTLSILVATSVGLAFNVISCMLSSRASLDTRCRSTINWCLSLFHFVSLLFRSETLVF